VACTVEEDVDELLVGRVEAEPTQGLDHLGRRRLLALRRLLDQRSLQRATINQIQ